MTKNSRTSFAIAILLLLAGTALRLYSIATLPPGLHAQEIIDVRLAENVRQGDVQVFFSIGGEGREGLYPTILAAITGLMGRGTIGYHIFSAWVGVLTLAVVYALARRLYGDLAGLAALALLAVSMWPVLLARQVGRETLLPLLASVVLLALALGLPVYWRRRDVRTQTVAFGALGLFVGLSFYVHPAGLIVALMAALIVIYMLARTRMSRQTRSYIIYTALMIVIVATPYLTSALRLPDLNGAVRLFRGGIVSDQPLSDRFVNGILGIGLVGDSDPTYNVPGRPLFDPLSFVLIGVGLVVALRYMRKARYAVTVIAVITLLPLALFAPKSPYFPAYAAVLPILVLLFGLGVTIVARRIRQRSVVYIGLALLTLFNGAWTVLSLFNNWPASPDVQTAYNSSTASLARYIDLTSAEIPTVICSDDVTRTGPQVQLSSTRLITLLMNRRDAPVREVDCNIGMVMANGGERQQIILTDPKILTTTNPLIQAWLADARPVEGEKLPSGMVWQLDVSQKLADTIGRFTTTAPVAYDPRYMRGQHEGFAPPVRFGNNLTFLGYESLPNQFQPGDTVTVVTYWRVDGMLPRDLELFTHILADPDANPLGNRSGNISVIPAQLKQRDIFMQVTYVPLSMSIPPRRYLVSIGAYRESSTNRERLQVFDSSNAPRGDRLMLYSIDVVTRTTDSSEVEDPDG